MDENKNEFEELENSQETVNETEETQDVEEEVIEEAQNAEEEIVEEYAGEAADAEADEAAEEAIDDDGVAEVSDDAEVDFEAMADVAEEVELLEDELAEETKKSSSVAKIVVLVAVLVVIVAGIIAYATGLIGGNKYNKLGYVNFSGQTIAEVAEQSGLTLEQFLSEYSLPADMPADTTVSAAVYNMPLSVYIKSNIGVEYEEVKDMLGLPTETTPSVPKNLLEKIISKFKNEQPQPIDGNTPWYIVEGEMTVEAYTGGDVDGFKEFYKLGDEVTGETRIKEIRDQMNKVEAELLAEQQAESAAEEAAGGEATEGESAEGEAETAEDTAQTAADAGAEGETEAETAAE